MIEREDKKNEEKSQDRAFLMFVHEGNQGLTFGDYYENLKKQSENIKMSIEDKDNEEMRILNKYSNIDPKDLKRKEF
jgi:hypothetical protein